jgi:sugar O-acyltransferase (sialic acid O-acetyltransferase NeuD family)
MIAIIGFGGFAREIGHRLKKDSYNYFIPNDLYNTTISQKHKNVLPIYKLDYKKYEIIVGIGKGSTRKKIIDEIPKYAKFYTFVDEFAKILDKSNVTIGEGSIICAGSLLTTNINIGKHSIINLNNTIGHDVTIGDFCTLSPGVNVSGNCNISNLVSIGTNSSIKENIKIVDNVIIGMGSCIIKDVMESGYYIKYNEKLIKQ